MTAAPFPILGDSGYAAYVGPLTHKGGANPSTHIASVRYPVQVAPIVSVVKLLPADGLRACNEVLAWLFLRAAGVRVARNAALLSLTEAKAVKVLGRKLVPKTLVHDKHVLAWAAQQLDFKSIQALFSGSRASQRWLALLQTVEGAAIAAFDETFLNVDRNPGNVLYASPNAGIAIDHELCFGMQNWRSGTLSHLAMDGDSLGAVRRAVAGNTLSRTAMNTIFSAMVLHGQRHGEALRACEGHMVDFLTRIYPSEAKQLCPRVLSFVAERTAQRWMEERLGVL